MIEFAKNGDGTHVVQRLDLTGHVRGKGHKWKEVVQLKISGDLPTGQAMANFIMMHSIADERDIRRQKVRITKINKEQHVNKQKPDYGYPL